MSRRTSRIALLAVVYLVGMIGLSVYSEAFEPPEAAPVVHHGHRGLERPRCGGYRWTVKTLIDPGAPGVYAAPRDTTVAALGALPARRPGTTRIAPIETQVWRLRNVRLVGLQHKPDGDIHLVVADDAGRTMITEFPSQACDRGAPPAFRREMDAARRTLLARSGAGGRATLTGVGFFDYSHGQAGAASNAIELHPVLSIAPAGVQEVVRPPSLR